MIKTKVHPIHQKGKTRSLRTTVPMFVVEHFELKKGDELKWDLKAIGPDKFVLVVTPVKKKI